MYPQCSAERFLSDSAELSKIDDENPSVCSIEIYRKKDGDVVESEKTIKNKGHRTFHERTAEKTGRNCHIMHIHHGNGTGTGAYG